MLACLWFDGLVGRDHKQNQIDSANPREHVTDKAFMSRDIHKSETQRISVSSWQLKMSKANINRDAAAFLFFQPVGIDPCQCLDQSGFTVVYVAGRSHDDRFHLLNNTKQILYSPAHAHATIEFPHAYGCRASHQPRTCPGTRTHSGRIRKDQTAPWRTPTDYHRARHIQRDVERALLIQVIPCSSEALADPQPPCCARSRRECRHY